MANLSKLTLMGRTLPRLGFRNVARVAAYRASLKFPSRLKKLSAETPHGPFFKEPKIVTNSPQPAALWEDEGKLFSFHPFPISDTPPDWHANPLTGASIKNAHRPWFDIPDFDPDVGDIKLIWELSRFCWLPAFAQRAKRGDKGALERLNNWLENWAQNNPPYQGPNWKCGQETSLRVLHLIVAADILGSPSESFSQLIRVHLKRIAPTVSYAMAQDNNHGTSEAAALFIGGNYIGDKKIEKLGRKLLENRVKRLVQNDGSFAQYSVNYHRLMLDALSLSEWWRTKNGLANFSFDLNRRMKGASDWLYQLTDFAFGDAPNIGANDGAQILQLTDAPYREFRPSVTLAQAVWHGRRVYPVNQTCNDHLAWLGIETDLQNQQAFHSSAAGEYGGFARVFNSATKIIMRHPQFKFRPSQCDALHLDIWRYGKNVLRDAGTYSYNTAPETMAYFNGANSHNTISFDGLDQMPRLGRFLLGDWLGTKTLSASETSVTASYKNRAGHHHIRSVELRENIIEIFDTIDGFKTKAVMRWRLIKAEYNLEIIDTQRVKMTGSDFTFIITCDVPISAVMTQGEESRHYLEKTSLPVLEVTVEQAGIITTKIEFTS